MELLVAGISTVLPDSLGMGREPLPRWSPGERAPEGIVASGASPSLMVNDEDVVGRIGYAIGYTMVDMQRELVGREGNEEREGALVDKNGGVEKR